MRAWEYVNAPAGGQEVSGVSVQPTWGEAPGTQCAKLEELATAFGRRHTLKVETAVDVIARQLKLYQEAAVELLEASDSEWRAITGGGTRRMKDSLPRVREAFLAQPFANFAEVNLPAELVERGAEDEEERGGGGYNLRARDGEGQDEAAAPEPDAQQRGRQLDVRAMLTARSKELYVLLCKYVWLLMSGPLKSSVRAHLREHLGAVVVTGSREMWLAIQGFLVEHGAPSDVWASLGALVQRARAMHDPVAVLDAVREWEERVEPTIRGLVSGLLYHHILGPTAVTALAKAGVPWDTERSMEEWTQRVNHLDAAVWLPTVTAALGARNRGKLPFASAAKQLGKQPSVGAWSKRLGSSTVGTGVRKPARKTALASGGGGEGGRATRRQRFDENRCFNCGEVGHQQRDCPKGLKCYRCNKTGHVKRDCPLQQRAPLCDLHNPRNPKKMVVSF